ncbi:MAG: MG2 domain-containing protein [Rhizobiaceae bacterium]
MLLRWARAFFLIVFTLCCAATALAGNEHRSIVTSKDSDYFGFDLRSEQNVTLDQCEASCLGDRSCRAFTYNEKAKWCFLKSDYSRLNPFAGAVAGKVVDLSADADIGAPAALSFLPASLNDEAVAYRQKIVSQNTSGQKEGLNALVGEAASLAAGDPRAAMQKYAAALAISPDDGALWEGLARAALKVKPVNAADKDDLAFAATSAATNAYRLSRTAKARAGALAVLAQGLDRRAQYRPAIQAYKASLALANDPLVRAAYLDLKARKGFRIVDHTIDAENQTPRACVQFSDPLVKNGVDYTPFVTVDGAQPKAIDLEEKQICVDGLEHGKRYRISFRAGLPSAIGEVLESPASLDIYVRDRSPFIRFTGDNFILPGAGRHGIPLVSVNTDEADLQLYRVGDRALTQLLSSSDFLRQLYSYDVDQISGHLGESVWKGKIEIRSDLNKEVVTSFPVDQALPTRKPGVYLLTAIPSKQKTSSDNIASQWFVVSDIGLSTYTGTDGITVFARSLATAKPLANVDLKLLARNNEVLGTAKTDANGRAAFAPGLARAEGGLVPAVLTASLAGKDFDFLDMSQAGFDLSDRGVGGRAAPGALDVYAWTERGIYRAGETVHAAALARNDSADAVGNLPLTFIFNRPDGVEDRRIVSNEGLLGGHFADLKLQPNAMRGTWHMSIYTDPKKTPVAESMFLVEDFVPDRIEFDLTSGADAIQQGQPTPVTVAGRFLYGAPASGLSLEGEVKLSTTREWKSFPGYQFGLADENADDDKDAMSMPLDDLPMTDDQGKATFDITLHKLPSTTRLLDTDVVVRMREGGGRAVERHLALPVEPQHPMIGVRPEFAGDQAPEDSTAKFQVIAADPSGKKIDRTDLNWSLVKIERNYQWYRANGSWNYEPVTYTKKIAGGKIDASASGEASIAAPVDWGRYRLEVSTNDPAGPATSVEFDAGWYVAASSTETPDALEIALDKASYKAGETAHLKISPRFAGELLVTIGADRLLATETASVPKGGATIDIPVKADWGAGAYVTATLFRPGNGPETRMPGRAIGVKWLKLDPGPRRLGVTLETPPKAESRKPLVIPVKLTGLKPGEEAYVTVAAVDVGILNLTRYQPPDPEAWYFGQRRMGIDIRDIYGRLIDGSAGAMGRIRTGGDGAQMSAQGSPPTQKLVASFSGPVKVDNDGRAVVSFDIPQFNGTVRVMAVAWSKTGVGHATSDVVIRDPVVVTASLPRFMAPGDHAEMRLDVANTDGPAGDYTLTVTSDGTVKSADDAPKTVTLAKGERKALTVPLTASAAGNAAITVRLANASGLSVEQVLPLPVRPEVLPVTTRQVINLAANGGAITIDKELLASSLLDGASVSVGVSSSAAFDVPSLLLSLDRYPYGCAEQTTSRALPLLYVSEMAKSAGLPEDPDLHKRVQDAIFKVLSYQSSSGSFGLWGPGSGDLWLDAYVSDFLTRAREQGYTVPAEGFSQALSNLQNALAYNTDIKDRGSEIAYALYVLARNRKASIGDLRYYADTEMAKFPSPMARAQLAAALALYGDVNRADAAFVSALGLAQQKAPANRASWSDYGSTLRDGAAMLALAAETKPSPATIPAMIKLVSAERASARYTSTQDEAWMVLAARAIKTGTKGIKLDVNGKPHDGAFAERVSGTELQKTPIRLVNKGADPVQAVVTAVAAPVQPLPAGGNGFSIERGYYTMDGKPADITEATQNERFVVVIEATEDNAWPSRVLITDLLPAGFQIDNPSLVGSAQLSNFDWLRNTDTAHTEFRDDRFVAAFDRNATSPRDITVAYVVRAVTPGIYALPAASIEDMYRPQFSARTATGTMEVKAAK